jgi:hypothetical protein
MASKQTVDRIDNPSTRTVPPSLQEPQDVRISLGDTRQLCAHLNEALRANISVFDAYDRLHEDVDDAELRNRFKILCDRTANDILEIENMIFGFGGTPELDFDETFEASSFVSANDRTADSDLNTTDATSPEGGLTSEEGDDVPKDYDSIH